MLRNVDAPEHFETFLVSAILSVLAIRAFLALTGFPQIGGTTLHIAHMLWGGLLMLVALTLLLGWLGNAVRGTAAVLGGIGFGAFIDEIGKFITADNDYFYRPAFALIYLTFVLLYIVFRAVQRPLLAPVERVANALELMQEAVRHDLDADERRRAVDLLSDSAVNDPIAAVVRAALARIDDVDPGPPGRLARMRAWSATRYARLVRAVWFRNAVVVVVCGLAAVTIVLMLVFAFFRSGDGLDTIEIIDLIARAIPAAILLFGLRHLRRSRLRTWQTFRTAILFQIFVTRVVTFYIQQFAGVLGLLADIVVLSVLRALIQQEQALARTKGVSGSDA